MVYTTKTAQVKQAHETFTNHQRLVAAYKMLEAIRLRALVKFSWLASSS